MFALHPFGLSLSKPECVRSFSDLGGVPALRAGAGSSPRRARYLFFASPKKSTQKKGDPQSATPALRYGATCGVSVAGCAVELALRWRAPLGQPRRARQRGMGASTPMLTPQPPRRRRSQQGVGSQTAEQPHGPSLRSARGRGAQRPRVGGRATRWPVWMSGSPVPSGCAEMVWTPPPLMPKRRWRSNPLRRWGLA